MGIHIHLFVSKSVTKQEWNSVYEESLLLAKAFPLADLKKTNIKDIETYCLVPTHEYEDLSIWNTEHKKVGWCTVGDYETLDTGEDYYTPRYLIEDKEFDISAGNAILGAIPLYNDFEEDDIGDDQVYHLWGNKTQGKPYHMYLLAIACMMESRLGKKAFVAGDITRGQCRKAVALANEYLEKPIDMPERCDMEQLHKRISKLSFGPKEQLCIFISFYLGTKDAEFGNYLRANFPSDVCYEYWKDRFSDSHIGTLGFNANLKEYLLWGFDLQILFELVNYYDENNQPQYEKFITNILDSKLHLKEKNCKDILDIDQESETPYTVNHLFAQFVYSASRNKKVDRYIPMEELRKILLNRLGDKCDVNQIITGYICKESLQNPIDFSKEIPTTEEELAELSEQDPAEVFQEVTRMHQQKNYEEYNEYDITLPEQLELYKKGNTLHPKLKEGLLKFFHDYTKSYKEDTFCLLKVHSAVTQYKCLTEIKQREILLRDKDWEKIFNNLEKDKEALKRYYILLYFKLSNDTIYHTLKAIVLNDDLYDYLVENCEYV